MSTSLQKAKKKKHPPVIETIIPTHESHLVRKLDVSARPSLWKWKIQVVLW
jgi:hypothetical protein